MKKLIIIILISLILFSCKKDPKDEIFNAIITFIMNKVEKSDGTIWKQAKLLDQIDVSLVVRTGILSKAEMNVNNKYRLLLYENTVFIPILLKGNDVSFNLKQGGVFGRIKKLMEGEKFTIVTPSTVIGVRGTDFFVSANEKGDMIAVHDGSVQVKLNIKKIDELKKHLNPAVRELYKLFSEYTLIEKNKSLFIDQEIIKQINNLVDKIITEPNPENLLRKILKIYDLKINIADKNLFIDSVNYMNSNPVNNNGKPIYLDGSVNETEIFVNNKYAGKGFYGKLFQSGNYIFKFKLSDKEHIVERTIVEVDFVSETIKAPFTNNMLRQGKTPLQQTRERRQGHYEANPDERAAN